MPCETYSDILLLWVHIFSHNLNFIHRFQILPVIIVFFRRSHLSCSHRVHTCRCRSQLIHPISLRFQTLTTYVCNLPHTKLVTIPLPVPPYLFIDRLTWIDKYGCRGLACSKLYDPCSELLSALLESVTFMCIKQNTILSVSFSGLSCLLRICS